MYQLKPYFKLWLSTIIFKISNHEIRSIFRQIEKIAIKLTETQSHLHFNECCLNIYIYIKEGCILLNKSYI